MKTNKSLIPSPHRLSQMLKMKTSKTRLLSLFHSRNIYSHQLLDVAPSYLVPAVPHLRSTLLEISTIITCHYDRSCSYLLVCCAAPLILKWRSPMICWCHPQWLALSLAWCCSWPMMRCLYLPSTAVTRGQVKKTLWPDVHLQVSFTHLGMTVDIQDGGHTSLSFSFYLVNSVKKLTLNVRTYCAVRW